MNRLSYSDRIPFCKNELAKKLFALMDEKKTNLALSADVSDCDELLYFADRIGPEICVFKTHVDILGNFQMAYIDELVKLAERHQFLIFEDRKFADIGNTVKSQYEFGIYHISDWAHIINAHALPGPGIVKALSQVGLQKHRGLLLLAEMSSEKNLLDAAYAKKTLEMAEQFPEFVMGFIAQHRLNADPQWLYMTPGVQLESKGDPLGQQYVTPEKAIVENDTDIIIVGRGILNTEDPLAAAKKYRAAGWMAHSKMLVSA